MLKHHPVPDHSSHNHEDLFLERYARLHIWALQLTDGDRELAEDLLHDLFIQFMLSRPAIDGIENLGGYLYTMLRNLHLAQQRRATRNRLQQLSIIEYDSAETGLRTVDLRDQIQAQDELRHVCRYACARKETAKLASVLILRFFHGYYPGEIGQVARSPRQAVDKWLRLARNEAKASLTNPDALRFIRETPAPKASPARYARKPDDFLAELRQMIFHACRGDCPPGERLRELYQGADTTPIACEQLAHFVSCQECLDMINRLLGLPNLVERCATDMAGRDTRDKGGRGGGTTDGGVPRKLLGQWRRRARETFEHKPQELCVSVNGHTLGSQIINSERSELNLIVDTAEQIDFIEVFSEQKIRLLLLDVAPPPPEGPGEQNLQLRLSDLRLLELSLRFTSPRPTINIIYHDPFFHEAKAEGLAIDEQSAFAATIVRETPVDESSNTPIRERSLFLPTRVRAWLTKRRFWLGPVTVTALLTLLIAVLLLAKLSPSTVSAARLLRRSAAADEALAAQTGQLLHRTINLEERRGAGGEVVARRKIEVWHSAEHKITARRVYDESGALIAGEWRGAGGDTLYRSGSQPRLRGEKQETKAISLDNVWLLDPSAKDFISLIGRTDVARIDERPAAYVISYSEKETAAPPPRGLVRAVLVLSRADLHAIEQTLIVRHADDPELREYRLTESSFERRAPGAVAPTVFEPEPVLVGSEAGTQGSDVTETMTAPPRPAVAATPVLATAELEIEALQLLNQVGADMDDQTTLTRTSDGRLEIRGIAETDQRRVEILRALAPVIKHPALKIEIETMSEALRRQQRSQAAPSVVVTQRVEVTRVTIPVHEELLQYFGGERSQADEQIRQFATRMLNRSRQALSQAGAIKRLGSRFSPEDLRDLSPEARAGWSNVIRAHARACEQEIKRLWLELQPIFFRGRISSEEADEIAISDDIELARAAERLFELVSANDQAIRSSFAVSTSSAETTGIKTPQFSHSLQSAERLAAKIASIQ
jgi:RNA polymerase sigma factor (sigma-70 family)